MTPTTTPRKTSGELSAVVKVDVGEKKTPLRNGVTLFTLYACAQCGELKEEMEVVEGIDYGPDSK